MRKAHDAGVLPGFIVSVTEDELRREKEKARELKKTRWWRQQVARGLCHYCRKSVAREEMTLDHIVPLVRGGQTTRSNVVLSCKTCNSRKKYLLPMEWEDYLGHFRRASTPGEEASGCFDRGEGEESHE
jgi:hypothetical protein